MAAAAESDERGLDDPRLPDHGAFDLVPDLVEGLAKALSARAELLNLAVPGRRALGLRQGAVSAFPCLRSWS